MVQNISIVFFALLFLSGALAHEEDDQVTWNYNDPDQDWCADFPTCCSGTSQSPIDLVEAEAKLDEDLCGNPLSFSSGYFEQVAMTIENTGKGVKITPNDEGLVLYISGGPMPKGSRYNLAEVNFRWGDFRAKGSEHTINGEYLRGEVQAVHVLDGFSNVNSAMKSGNSSSIVVLSFLIEEQHGYTALQTLKIRLPSIWKAGKSAPFTTRFSRLFSMVTPVEYMTYEGSLTHPGCEEGATWIVMRDPLKMSTSQLFFFRGGIRDEDNNPIIGNFRPIQSTNSRVVRRTFHVHKQH